MCGIAGLISSNPEARVGSMLKAIEHRGRDDEGVWTSHAIDEEGRRVSFGHRRLAIIDTSSAGHQPMLSADGRYVVTFNGEIYNYRELKRRLESLGREFHTDTDTEVLLEAFAEWGAGCLSHLNGMFAFAVWDARERTLTLARDRLGIKPLFYAKAVSAGGGESFVFASEAKAILASGLVRAELDAEALNQQLTFLWTPDPHTLFRNIRRLPPAHVLTWRDGELTTREWWDVSFDEIEEGRGEEWWRERVLETLDRVVGMEMVADVPLGSFLSGGVDSSVVTALMNRQGKGRRVSTYTVGIEEDDLRYDIIPSDVPWARKVGRLLDADYHETMLRPDVATLLPLLVRHLEMPVIDMAISSYLVSREARRTLTVMLSGMGGDEVFAGYPRQLAMSIAGALDTVPSSLRRPAMRAVAGALPGGMPGRMTAPLRNAKKFARSAALDFESRYLGFGTYFTDEAKHRLYGDELREATEGLDAYYLHRRYFARCSKSAPLNRLLYVDMKTFLPCLNLDYTDRTSMAATLEVRVPLVNHELVELAARMPPRLKLRGLRRKYILKRAAERLLPRDVVWRRKAGFGAPIRAWLRGPLRPLVEEMLSEEAIKRRGLFRPEEVRRVVEANLSGREDYALHVLQLLTLEMWQREFLDEQAVREEKN
ncbi:MAG TPA: asparagine synthase (glutamine-hydrolyzing) [Pyrinomonadaceae bacterium]|nr:asparagine synthase (glutamine-hydrolyzing) [Pyrinomonadaceae bacterium]